MKSGKCKCDNRLFFSNSICLKCSRSVGRCDTCLSLTGFDSSPDNSMTCTHCGTLTKPCKNQAVHACNSFVKLPKVMCQWCEFTSVLPDLTKPGNHQRWVELERAKRRLLVELQWLGFPPFVGSVQSTHPLTFQFLEDTILPDNTIQKTYTGHANGVVVINLLEADSVYREKTRVTLGEPQRTLIGHMRHEVGHYLDWALASRFARNDYLKLFGDPAAFNYDAAIQKHYQIGAPPNWENTFVSAYASMHPWEDFAETVNVYLDVMAIGETANDQGMASIDLNPTACTTKIIERVLEIAVSVSEFNLDFGLLPLLPEKFSPKVIEKLNYVHGLRSKQVVDMLLKANPK